MKRKSPAASAMFAVICLILATTGCSVLSSTVAPSLKTSASENSLTVSGAIAPSTSAAGVVVKLSGAANATATTDSTGHYSFAGLSSGNYIITPAKKGFVFTPASQQVMVTAETPENNFRIGRAPTVPTNPPSSPTNPPTNPPTSNPPSTPPAPPAPPTPAPPTPAPPTPPAPPDPPSPPAPPDPPSTLKPSGPIVINGESGTVIEGLKITSTTGDCVKITNSTNITIQNSEIGPCAGNGVKIMGGKGINIFDSYIHPETHTTQCCDHNDGVFAKGGTQSLLIQGNVIAYGESNIEVQGGTAVTVVGNLLLNPRGAFPRGNNFQCWNECVGVTVQNNYALSSLDTALYKYPEATEDSISFGITSNFVAQNNYVTGGHSVSGCGIMADTYSNGGQIVNNQLVNTGQCGIGIVDGSHIAHQNHVYNTNPVPGGGNTAMYVAHYGQSSVCGPILVTNNVADEIRTNGVHSGWWNGENCGVINIDTNQFGKSADTELTPQVATVASPMIPPQPKNCAVSSPYTTQTSVPACQ